MFLTCKDEKKEKMATIADLEKQLNMNLGLMVIFRAKPATKLNVTVTELDIKIKKSPANTGLKTIAGRILELTSVPFVVIGAFAETVSVNPKLGDLHATCTVYDIAKLHEEKK